MDCSTNRFSGDADPFRTGPGDVMRHTQPFPAKAAAGQVHLRLLSTTDLHMQVMPHDYYTDRPAPGRGLAALAGLVATLRAETGNTLLFDVGDMLQGNPLGDYVARDAGPCADRTHPMIAAMNALGYDAATLGNHDFNYGLDFLLLACAGASFPVVLANIVLKKGASPLDDTPLLPPYRLLRRRFHDGAGEPADLTIGVFGVAPPQIVEWDGAILEGRVRARDIVETARAWVPEIRRAGADIVVALAHTGIGAARASRGMENAAVPLAAVRGVDAVLAGHSHLVFPGSHHAGMPGVDTLGGTLHGKPAVMGGYGGSHLGVIDLLLDQRRGRWRPVAHLSEARGLPAATASGGPAADPVVRAVAKAHAGTLASIRRPVGHTDKPLFSHFAPLGPAPALRLVAEAKLAYLRNLLREAGDTGPPALAAVAPFKAGGLGGPMNYSDIAAGPLALRHLADLYHYPNALRVVSVTGAEIAEWLERAAGLFNRILPGARDQPLIDPDFPSYNFDVLHGLSYVVDVARPSRYDARGRLAHRGARRVRDICHDGRPIDAEDRFLVVTNSYRTGGGGGFPVPFARRIVHAPAILTRDVLTDHVRRRQGVSPEATPVWRLAPCAGATAIFDTGPGARAHLGTPGLPPLQDLGDTAEGFARFRVTL